VTTTPDAPAVPHAPGLTEGSATRAAEVTETIDLSQQAEVTEAIDVSHLAEVTEAIDVSHQAEVTEAVDASPDTHVTEVNARTSPAGHPDSSESDSEPSDGPRLRQRASSG
jgi:hypothetical protein